MPGPTALEVAASLPPLTDEQVQQIAALLNLVHSIDGAKQ